MNTMDKITFGIAVVGFLLSVYNFIEGLIAKSRRITISMLGMCRCGDCLAILLVITNKSRLGISLTSGKIDGTAFGETRETVFTYANPELAGRSTVKTTIFPIHLEPLSATRLLLLVEERDLPIPSPCVIRLGSSRGKISKKLCPPFVPVDFPKMLKYLK